MPSYILAHDVGTTNHKCIVFNENGDMITSASRSYPTFYAQGGIAEQNPDDWWRNFIDTTAQVLLEINPKDISVISFSAHMNGCLPVDRSGQPLMASIIHADTRSSEIEDDVYRRICEDQLYQTTGNRIDSRYPLLKMYWLKEKRPEIYNQTAFFLQAKDYLAYKLTGNIGITDFSDASLTGALNLQKREWESPIFTELGLNISKMPEVVPSTQIVGGVKAEAANIIGLTQGTPVVIGGGDGACATVGAGCLKSGDTYISLGTTAWVSKVVDHPFIDPEKRVFTICDLNPDYYNVLGTVQTAGGAYEWAINQFSSVSDWEKVEVVPEYDQFEKQLKKVPAGSRGLFFHPYLLGERSPIWNEKARGSFLGIRLDHNRFDFAKAVLEGIALSLGSISEIINSENSVKEINLIGGLVKSQSLIQITSDVLKIPVQLTKNPSEATSIGAAIAGGVGVGIFSNFEDAAHIIKKGKRYEPIKKNRSLYEEQLVRFKQLYQMIKDFDFSSLQ